MNETTGGQRREPRRCGEYTTEELARYSGASYRQIDYWTRSARLFATQGPAPGSGSTRTYPFFELLVATLIARLSRSSGLGMAEHFARILRADPTADVIAAPLDPDEPIVTLTINVANLRVELLEQLTAGAAAASQTQPLRWEKPKATT